MPPSRQARQRATVERQVAAAPSWQGLGAGMPWETGVPAGALAVLVERTEDKVDDLLKRMKSIGADTMAKRACVAAPVGFIGGMLVKKTQDALITTALLGGACLGGRSFCGRSLCGG